MGDIAHLPERAFKGSPHITVNKEEFAEKIGLLLADAEDKGARAMLIALSASVKTHMDHMIVSESTREARGCLYAALIMQTMGEIAK